MPKILLQAAPLKKSTYLDRGFQFQQYGLGDEDLAGLLAQVTYLCFKKLDLLPGSTSSHFEQPIDDGIQVHIILIRHAVVPVCGATSAFLSSGRC